MFSNVLNVYLYILFILLVQKYGYICRCQTVPPVFWQECCLGFGRSEMVQPLSKLITMERSSSPQGCLDQLPSHRNLAPTTGHTSNAHFPPLSPSMTIRFDVYLRSILVPVTAATTTRGLILAERSNCAEWRDKLSPVTMFEVFL